MNTDQFFKDLKVIELASVLAGPAVGMFFAEMGAKVIKIENKKGGGDTTRKWKLPSEDVNAPYSAYYHSVNWGKESVLLDLTESTDFNWLMEEMKTADVLISNFKAGSAEKLKLDYPTLKSKFPKLISGSITAYGKDNPKPGFDVVIQAETGWLSMNGEEGGAPVKMPVALMDILAAHQLKEAILVGLLHRARTGEGSEFSVSLFDTGVASLANQATNWLNVKHLPKRMGSRHPNIAPYGEIFYTKDKKPVILAPGTEQQFRNLCDCLNLPELKNDPAFQTNALRLTNRIILNESLKLGFLEVKLDDILKRCHQEKVPIAPINNLAELFEMPMAQKLVLEEQLSDGTISKRVKTKVF